MAKVRAKRRSEKCDSCRKLKISCDKVRPSCEYCIATHRICVYEIDLEAKPTNSQHNSDVSNLGPTSSSSSNSGSISSITSLNIDNNSSSNFNSNDSMLIPENSSSLELSPQVYSINDVGSQMGISNVELKLLKYFSDYYLSSLISQNQLDTTFQVQIPYAWSRSPILRQVIYSLSCLSLYYMDDIGTKYLQDSIPKEEHSHDLYYYTMKYFNECISLNQLRVREMMEKTQSQSESPESELESPTSPGGGGLSAFSKRKLLIDMPMDVALENILANMLLFSFFMVQPFNVLPLLTFDGTPDLIEICRGMKLTMGPSFKILEQSPFNTLTKLNDTTEGIPVKFFAHFPFIKNLRDDLNKLSPELDFESFSLYDLTIDRLIAAFYNSIIDSNASHLYSWLFCMENEHFDRMKDKEYFALKLLFVYACFCIWGGITATGSSIIVLDFLEIYKKFNFGTFGKWYDENDYYSYILAKNLFVFPNFSLNILKSFDPKRIVLESGLYDDVVEDEFSNYFNENINFGENVYSV